MTSIIYACLINSIPVYVGSAYDYRYESRQNEHMNKPWLKDIEKSSIKFVELEKCENEVRFEREGLHLDQLLVEGFQLFNKRDPRSREKFIASKESAAKILETKKRKGSLYKGGAGNKGKKQSSKTINARITALKNSPNAPRFWRAEVRLIMNEFNCSYIEACRIRKSRKA